MRIKITGRLLARNTLLNLIGQVVPLCVGVASIPYVIRGLGTERFGILSLAWVILGYFTIFDLGLGGATTKYVAEALGRGEEDRVPSLVWTTVVIQLILGLLSVVALILLTPFLVEHMLTIPPTLAAEAKSMFQLLAFSIPAVLVSGSFSGVLQAAQRFDLLNVIRIPSSSCTFLLPLVCLILGFELLGIVAFILVSRIIMLLTLIVVVLQIFPNMRHPSVSFALFPRLFTFGSWVMVSSLVAPLLLYLDRFLIGALLSIADVAYYTAPFEVISRLGIIPASFAIALFPAFSTLGSMHKERLQGLYVRSTKYLFLLIVPIIMMLIVFSSTLLHLWLGSEFVSRSTPVFQILLMGALFALLSPVPGGLIQGLGRPDLVSKLYLLYFPLNVAIVWFFVKNFGLVGAAASFALRAFIEATTLFIISSQMIKLPYNIFLESKFGHVLAISLAYIGLLWMISSLDLRLLQILLAVTLIGSFVVLAWICMLDDIDKNIIISARSKVIATKRIGHS
jgi:O-antigen/teichoic acid export membrane protein